MSSQEWDGMWGVEGVGEWAGGMGRGCPASSGGCLGVGVKGAQGDLRSREHSGIRDRFAISRSGR